MPAPYGFNDKAIAEKLKRQALQQPDAPPVVPDFRQPQQTWLFRNDHGTEVPPYGIIAITGTDTIAGRYGFKATQANGQQPTIAFNGSNKVPPGKLGVCQFGPVSRAAYQAGVTIGVGYVGVTGWHLDPASGHHPMLSLGVVDMSVRIALVQIMPDITAFFKTPGSGFLPASNNVTPSGPVMCERYWFAQVGSFGFLGGTSPPVFENVYSNVLGPIKGNVVVQAKRLSGRWFVDVEDCNQ